MSTDKKIPRHVGLILDGNRRWARDNNLPTLEGHQKGFESLKSAVRTLHNEGVEFVSAYIFSTENWNRAEAEVKYLMDLALKVVVKDLDELDKDGVRVLWAGQENNLKPKLIKAINNAIERTKDNTNGTLVLCFNYGGHHEIAHAAASMIEAGLDPASLTPEVVSEYIYNPNVPAIDLIIRSSGEQRLSGFQLWRAAYSEFIFLDKHWPAVTEQDLQQALADYANRERRFGGN